MKTSLAGTVALPKSLAEEPYPATALKARGGAARDAQARAGPWSCPGRSPASAEASREGGASSTTADRSRARYRRRWGGVRPERFSLGGLAGVPDHVAVRVGRPPMRAGRTHLGEAGFRTLASS